MRFFNKFITATDVPEREEQARQWYREKANEVERLNSLQVIRQAIKLADTRFRLGHVYVYKYDPKHKATLPYYDRFPVVIPFSPARDGFKALNLHYLPIDLRARLLDELYSYVVGEEDLARFRITYRILSSAAALRFYKPCIKHYLNNYIQTRFIHVDVSDWDIAMFLPLQSFAKARESKVHQDSIKKIRNP